MYKNSKLHKRSYSYYILAIYNVHNDRLMKDSKKNNEIAITIPSRDY